MKLRQMANATNSGKKSLCECISAFRYYTYVHYTYRIRVSCTRNVIYYAYYIRRSRYQFTKRFLGEARRVRHLAHFSPKRRLFYFGHARLTRSPHQGTSIPSKCTHTPFANRQQSSLDTYTPPSVNGGHFYRLYISTICE